MNNEYEIQVDVLMSGTVYITASSEEEAKKKVYNMQFVASDLRNFNHIETSVVDIIKE